MGKRITKVMVKSDAFLLDLYLKKYCEGAAPNSIQIMERYLLVFRYTVAHKELGPKLTKDQPCYMTLMPIGINYCSYYRICGLFDGKKKHQGKKGILNTTKFPILLKLPFYMILS